MRVSQAAIDAGVVAGRKTLDQASSFESGLVSDEMLTTFVTDVLTAGFGTVPNNSIVGPGAHVHPNVNPKATEENTLVGKLTAGARAMGIDERKFGIADAGYAFANTTTSFSDGTNSESIPLYGLSRNHCRS